MHNGGRSHYYADKRDCDVQSADEVSLLYFVFVRYKDRSAAQNYLYRSHVSSVAR